MNSKKSLRKSPRQSRTALMEESPIAVAIDAKSEEKELIQSETEVLRSTLTWLQQQGMIDSPSPGSPSVLASSSELLWNNHISLPSETTFVAELLFYQRSQLYYCFSCWKDILHRRQLKKFFDVWKVSVDNEGAVTAAGMWAVAVKAKAMQQWRQDHHRRKRWQLKRDILYMNSNRSLYRLLWQKFTLFHWQNQCNYQRWQTANNLLQHKRKIAVVIALRCWRIKSHHQRLLKKRSFDWLRRIRVIFQWLKRFANMRLRDAFSRLKRRSKWPLVEGFHCYCTKKRYFQRLKRSIALHQKIDSISRYHVRRRHLCTKFLSRMGKMFAVLRSQLQNRHVTLTKAVKVQRLRHWSILRWLHSTDSSYQQRFHLYRANVHCYGRVIWPRLKLFHQHSQRQLVWMSRGIEYHSKSCQRLVFVALREMISRRHHQRRVVRRYQQQKYLDRWQDFMVRFYQRHDRYNYHRAVLRHTLVKLETSFNQLYNYSIRRILLRRSYLVFRRLYAVPCGYSWASLERSKHLKPRHQQAIAVVLRQRSMRLVLDRWKAANGGNRKISISAVRNIRLRRYFQLMKLVYRWRRLLKSTMVTWRNNIIRSQQSWRRVKSSVASPDRMMSSRQSYSNRQYALLAILQSSKSSAVFQYKATLYRIFQHIRLSSQQNKAEKLRLLHTRGVCLRQCRGYRQLAIRRYNRTVAVLFMSLAKALINRRHALRVIFSKYSVRKYFQHWRRMYKEKLASSLVKRKPTTVHLSGVNSSKAMNDTSTGSARREKSVTNNSRDNSRQRLTATSKPVKSITTQNKKLDESCDSDVSDDSLTLSFSSQAKVLLPTQSVSPLRDKKLISSTKQTSLTSSLSKSTHSIRSEMRSIPLRNSSTAADSEPKISNSLRSKIHGHKTAVTKPSVNKSDIMNISIDLSEIQFNSSIDLDSSKSYVKLFENRRQFLQQSHIRPS